MTDTSTTDDVNEKFEIGRRRLLETGVAGVSLMGMSAPTVAQKTARQHDDLVPLTHGVAAGDVSVKSAVIWARIEDSGTIHVEYTTGNFDSGAPRRNKSLSVTDETDYVGKIRLNGLRSATWYRYRVWATEGPGKNLDAPDDAKVEGRFLTAPKKHESAPIEFAWSGDGYDDDANPPFPLLETITESRPDFFIYNGDTIYADADTSAGEITESTDPEESLPIYRAKHREMRTGTNLQELLALTSVYAMWDDHEVINNFVGPEEPLMPYGRRAFMEYYPIDDHPSITGSDPHRMYRKFRWGKHMELFIIDTRQYRSPNTAPDDEDKTLLGKEQLEWLLEGLHRSAATFKIIVNSFPLSFPGVDGWPGDEGVGGFETELSKIVNAIETDEQTVVWLSGDCHHAQVVSYDPDEDDHPDFWEITAGPLGGREDFPHSPLDETFNPTNLYAEGGFHNYGTVSIDEDGEAITVEIRDTQENIHYSKTIRVQ